MPPALAVTAPAATFPCGDQRIRAGQVGDDLRFTVGTETVVLRRAVGASRAWRS
ncbi:MAG: hypothetical protein MUC77_06580 [Chromatiaceae bacterium]|jgi:hypothetical protein|nr:hypothetical protein [Chromatiaceae bacterium]